MHCTGVSGAEQAYLVYRLYAELKRPLFVLCANAKEAESLAGDIRFFSGKTHTPIISFPSYDILPFGPISYHHETSCQRVEALYQMMTASEPFVIITTASALLQKVMPKAALSRFAEYLLPGEDTDRDAFVQKLIQGGYQETVLVEESGDYAVRGALIDVFPPLHPDPIRIEFLGDTIESIRTFSAQDQRSLKTLTEVTLLPARETVLEPAEIDHIVARIRRQGQRLEMPGLRIEQVVENVRGQNQFPGIGGLIPLIYPSLDTLFDYLPEQALPILIDPAAIEKRALETQEAVTKSYLSATNDGHICVEPEALCLTWPQVEARISHTPHLAFKFVPVSDRNRITCNFAVEKNDLIMQQLKARAEPDALLQPLVDWINRARENGFATYLVCRTTTQAKRLEGLLMPYGLDLRPLDAFPSQASAEKAPTICLGELSSGFVWGREALAVITDNEVFGPKHRLPKTPRKEARTEWVAFEDLKAGDLVVHVEHGVGRYNGLIKLEVASITNDFLALEYRDGDKLYVPVDRMDCVQKYVGVEGVTPRLDKMGGKSWERVKARVKESIRKMAGELLKLYAWRKVQKGHPFSTQDQYLKNFEAAFEYTETPDQSRAVEDVMADMESPVPMDRLICGDVGYGKTEIALRAAFKAVWDNKQVAFLVPTTVLAEQHFQTFRMRFEPYPIEIEMLSRFRSTSQQRAVVQKLKEGRADIVIGTHRLLQKDIALKDLGLVIIDEEQRFGVAHKEKLKQLRRCVDVLALTATPIPRTLHMSLMGIRDLSVISTPPEYRYAIKTYICPLDDTVVAEAIHRESQRGGQVFFVHNNIRTIWAMAGHLGSLVPGVQIGVAHGRLGDEELEAVMLQFLHHEIDVLVCTTIIEAGLDFPSANTILINRADKFGLAQIYQLRGRVGRGDEQAYAYLFIPHESALSRDAQKRLKVLMEHSDLGSGFQIAMSDLQIRGSGTMLGPTQSGHIASVGHEMYLQLMERTMSELKGEPIEQDVEPEIIVNHSAYIPEGYISNIDQRLITYRRLAKVIKISEVENLRKELRDRFGPLPAETVALLEKIMLKILCKKIGVQRLELGTHRMVITFSEKTRVVPEKITNLVQKDPQRFRLTPDYVLQVRVVSDGFSDPVEATKKVLQELA
jgi:transcription-repair coupling factor (superfamily II helicase)